jgi:D-glycero-D-manno-heptose 1,7-bisphosphate phosphatase
MENRYCFLDRDGVLIDDIGYPHQWEESLILSDNIKNLTRLLRYNVKFIIITNQSGIGRGYFSEKIYLKFSKQMLKELFKLGLPIQNIYHCPHKPDANCNCRKPKTGLLKQAFLNLRTSKKKCILIGDRVTDVECGLNFGITNSYLLNSKEISNNSHIAQKFMSNICDDIINKIEKEKI